MKYVYFISALFIFTLIGCSESKPPVAILDGGAQWLKFEELAEINKTDPKETLVFVHANWCPKCKRLFEETFRNPKLVQELNTNFHFVLLNAHSAEEISYKGKSFGNPTYDSSKGKDEVNSYHELLYEIQAKSIPSMVFLDKEMNYIECEMGFKEASELRSLMKMYNSDY